MTINLIHNLSKTLCIVICSSFIVISVEGFRKVSAFARFHLDSDPQSLQSLGL